MYKYLVASLVFSFVLLGGFHTARAECRSGTVQCGTNYCSPVGNQCCASVGRPDISCRSGSRCTASGCVSTSSDDDGCQSGYTSCGEDYCTPVGRTCCASVGRPDISCASGSRCTASGCVSTSGGTGGSTGGTGGSTGGSCSSGKVECGEDYCSPAENQCCAHVGRPDISCRSGSTCTASGCVSSSGGSSGGSSSGTRDAGSSGSGGSGGFSSTTNGDYTCSGQVLQSCSLRYCLSDDVESCYYEVDGRKISCGGCTSQSALMSCAQKAVDICLGRSTGGGGSGGSSSSGSSYDDEEDSGCSALPTASGGGAWLLALGALLLRNRRRRERA